MIAISSTRRPQPDAQPQPIATVVSLPQLTVVVFGGAGAILAAAVTPVLVARIIPPDDANPRSVR